MLDIASLPQSFRRTLCVVIGVLLASASSEIALRLAYPPNNVTVSENDAQSGLLHYVPHSSFEELSSCFDNIAETNDMGFHGRDVGAVEDPSIFRIVLIGSSFVDAVQVTADEMLSSLLEDKLNASSGTRRYQVVPIGFSGNGTYLDQLYYERWGAPLEPDLVINLSTEYEIGKAQAGQLNDDGSVVPLAQTRANSPSVELKNFLRHSRLIMSLYSRYLLLKSNRAAFFAQPAFFAPDKSGQNTPDDMASWPTEERLIDSFANAVKADGSHFMLVSWMTRNAGTTTAQDLPKKMAQTARARDFAYLNLNGPIASSSAATGESAVWPCDEHWSAAGQRFAADAIYSYLEANQDLLK